MKISRQFFFAIAGVCTGLSAFAEPLSGTKSVGPTGDYPSLTAAIADVQTQTVGGALVLELQSTYVSSVETFPLTVPTLNGASESNPVTIRPASGATGLSITSATTSAATVDLNGAQFVTFDGRAGGAGTAKQLTIANTNTAGVAVRFINEGSRNALRFLTLRGVNTSATSGTVLFGTTTGANGNDNNTIDTCDIRDGATTPANGIYALGKTDGTIAQFNSGNTVSNCNIFNFYSNTVDAAGVYVFSGNTDWTISGNSVYQTASRAAGATIAVGLGVNEALGNFTVTGNFIGGSAANAAGGWATTGTTTPYRFFGIYVVASTTTPTSVQGNSISNIVWTSSSNASAAFPLWSGVYVNAGAVNIGTTTGNTIGSGTGTGSISVTTSGNSGAAFGIYSSSAGTVAIANNTIGSMTISGTTTGISSSIIGIQVAAGTNTISGNTIGSTTTPNSLNAPVAAGDTGGVQQVTGIISSSTGRATITGNTLANFNNNTVSTTSASVVRGIATSAGQNTITGNTVRDLVTTSRTSGVSAYGIVQTSTVAGQTLSQNVVHSISNISPTNAVVVVGISYSGNTTTGPNIIARNFVHSLSVTSTVLLARVLGMEFGTGTFTAQNNVVRVGVTSSGASTQVGSGIADSGSTPGRRFYNNSVYVGGSNSGTGDSVAFFSGGTTNLREYRNNIFFNARSNTAGSAKHRAVSYGPGGEATGLTSDNNIYFVSGTGGVLAFFNSVDRTTLASWQSVTGMDRSTINADPRFANPAGTAATVDLHLLANSPAEGAGADVGVADDIDGQTRSGLTPVDIGADAGDYGIGLAYPLLGNSSTASRTLNGWANINSSTGVSSGANAPRFYFKKATDADAFGVANNSTGNGWKFVTASDASSPYSFTINYALLTGGGVASGDTIQYFVVAQNDAGSFRSTPFGAVTTANSVQNVSAKPTNGVNSYTIVNTIGGTVTVGSGGNFSSFSGAGGLFAAINSRVVTSNIVVNVIGNTTEDGSTVLGPLNSNSNFPLTNAYTVTIQPSSATMRTISGSGAVGLIRLSGAQGVTINGSFGGSGRFLTFRNTHINGATLLFNNDASNNTVRNCVLEGVVTDFGKGVVFFTGGVATGNDNNVVTENVIRDRSDAAGVPVMLVAFESGSPGSQSNSNNTISNNALFNFTFAGVYVSSGTEGGNITGNTIYQTAARTTFLTGIYLSGLGVNTIQGNVVRDLTSSGNVDGIRLAGQSGSTIAAGNRMWNLGNTAASTAVVRGINLVNPGPGPGHNVTLVNNMIALESAGTTAQNIYGIRDNGSAGSTTVAAYNSVLISGSGGAGADTWAYSWVGTSGATVKNNIFLNLRTGGSNHFAANRLPASTGPLAMDYNIYSGTGLATSANFFDSSNGSNPTGTPISYAQWQTSVPSDTHSSAGNPGGNFSSAMFTAAATGDLHLVVGGNSLVNYKGAPVAGVTDDFDGFTRSATVPFIGADEFNTAPVLTLPASPVVAEATSASGAVVTFTVSALDAEEGTIATMSTPASGSIFPVGDTIVNVSTTDSGLLTTSNSFIVRVRDTIAPIVTVPSNISVPASSLAGAVVNFSVTANDTVNGALPAIANPASGSVFAIGTTTVNVTATDAASNVGSASFTVTVVAPGTTGNGYSGLLRDTSGKVRGSYVAKLGPTGFGSIIVWVDGRRAGHKVLGQTTLSLVAGRVPMTVSFPAGAASANGYPTRTVSVIVGGEILTGTATHSPYETRLRSTNAGKYTFAATSPTGTPRVAAAMSGSITPSGAVRVTARLGNGRVSTFSSQEQVDGTIAVYCGYGIGGAQSLTGTLAFTSSTAPQLTGTLRWSVPARVDARLSAGVDADYDAIGARFTASPVGNLLELDAAKRVDLGLEIPSLTPSVKTFSLSLTANVLPVRTTRPYSRIRFFPATGMFSGATSFDFVQRNFYGVLLQGTGLNYGVGYLQDTSALGTVTIDPATSN
jgi:trimeric autotransporter adhesin